MSNMAPSHDVNAYIQKKEKEIILQTRPRKWLVSATYLLFYGSKINKLSK